MRLLALLVLGVSTITSSQSSRDPSAPLPSATTFTEWHFVVSGDSRNCGDLIMPAIAAEAAQFKPAFYWHLGDIRAIYEMDEDYAGELDREGKLRKWDSDTYVNEAWDDFEQMQIRPFEQQGIPFVVGIGNHKTIKPKTREAFLSRYTRWTHGPDGSLQRHDADLKDAYFSWVKNGIEFIFLDNSTPEQFDYSQLKWLSDRVKEAETDSSIKAVVVGMHKPSRTVAATFTA